MPVTFGDRRPDPSTLTIMALNAEFLWDGVAPEEGHERVEFPWRGNPVEAERHMRDVAAVVSAADPDVVPARVRLLADEERAWILRNATGPARERESGWTLAGILRRQARIRPDAAAARWAGRMISYAELAARAGHLARRGEPQ